MEKENVKAKGVSVLNNIVHGTVDAGKKAFQGAKDGVSAAVEKGKTDSHARRLKKLNPLFPEQYQNPEFKCPNMIIIVDDAVRRGIAGCEGAIGWTNKDLGMEVLYLYDEAIAFSGLHFIPNATCDAMYYVDPFDRNKFIRIDYIFAKTHEEKLAELKHIAHALGAKHCSIEICEKVMDSSSKRSSAGQKLHIFRIGATDQGEFNSDKKEGTQRSGRIEIELEGNASPIIPTLKWFAHEDSIKRLIDMRIGGNNLIKSETLELSGSTFATMTQKAAYTIDVAVGKFGNGGNNFSMEEQAAREHQSKMYFHVDF